MNEQSPEPRRRVDATSLRALAHPLRMRILDALRVEGPATSARLSTRLGESTGTISWHLRLLAEHGFIEEETGRGTKRERWWRAARGQNVITTTDFDHDPEAKGVARAYLSELLRQQFQDAAASLAAEWTDDWRNVGSISNWPTLRLTPSQLRSLNDELIAVVNRYKAEAAAAEDPQARPVVVQIHAIPRKDPESA